MSEFSVLCENTVKRFLKTVTIIDDEAVFGNMPEVKELTETADKLTPPLQYLTLIEKNNSHVGETVGAVKDIPSETDTSLANSDIDGRHMLSATQIVNSFSELGIICCVQRYDKDQPVTIATNLAKSTDVFIIDWDLNKNKTAAREIIKEILANDKDAGGRIRLIIVYTAENFNKQMLNDVKEEISGLFSGELSVDDEKFCIEYEQIKIVFFNKERTLPTADSLNIVPFSQLPNSVITEFTELVKGIIPCTALNIIAAMREQTHKLLSIFNRSLDAPFVHHSLHANDDFAIKLITGEMETILQSDDRANEMVGKESIDLWLQNFSTDRDEIAALEKTKTEKLGKDEKAFCNKTVGEKGASLWKKLSHIQSTSRDNFTRTYIDNGNAPPLCFGTILEENNTDSKKCYICLHPPCDSIRPIGPTEFIFACLNEGNGFADIIIQTEKEEYNELALKTDTLGSKKIRIRTISFTPVTDEKPIYGLKKDGDWLFKSSDETIYRWLGEVRKEKAIELKQRAMANANREGFDQFTWLRVRSSGR